MSFLIRYCSPVLLLTSVALATSPVANETVTGDTRSPRVTGRIVKLYSGTKPEPIVCAGEGFQVDPSDCAVFYRCVKSDKGKYTIFRFQCGPGTIYDPDTEVCNHPKSTKRSDCHGLIAPDPTHHEPGHEDENEIDASAEVPSPINVNRPTFVEHNTVKRDDASSTAIPWISTPLQTSSAIKLSPTSTTMSVKPTNQKSDPQAGDKCTSDGFMGDSKNCHVFYRCVGNGRGGYMKYQFSCSDDTIWDDDVQNCNYPSSVKRSRCGRSTEIAKENSVTTEKLVEKVPTIQQQTQVNYGSKVSQLQLQINNGTVTQNQTQINYGHHVNQSQKQENFGTNNKQNQKQISYDSALSQTQAQINNGNKAFQTQVQIDHTKQASQQQHTVSYGSNEEDTTQTDIQNNPQGVAVTESSHSENKAGGNKCSTSGFMGDSNDCKKFYRCVDNGRGSFTRYEFTCGDGTVWDSNIEACNHQWAVTNCGETAPTQSPSSSGTSGHTTPTTAVTKTTPKPQTTTEHEATDDDDEDTSYGNQNQAATTTRTTPRPEATTEHQATDDDNEDTLYGNPNQAATTTRKPTTIPSPSKGTTEEPKSEGSECKQSGFLGDPSDCKKFYRCVDNGRGSFTRYEFSCGEGTVWDPEIDGCNHVWAVPKCGGSSTSDQNNMETAKTTTTTLIEGSDHIQSTSKPTSTSIIPTTENDDYDTGYGHPESSSAPSSTTTTKEPQFKPDKDKDNTCRSSGFMGDVNDCKKFYRCVDNGNGGYTRYEFSCGEGTVWDNSIDACNHAWAVRSCGTGADHSPQIPTEVATEETITSESESTGLSQESSSSATSVFTSESTMTTKSPEYDEVCTNEGFKGDRKDCKKFYRCVDNGKGRYTKYEFTCGEGTVWDSEIQGCNHPSSSNNCASSQTISTTTDQTPQHPEIENDDSNSETTSKTTTEYNQMTISQTSTTQKPQSSGGTCVSEGFYGYPNDCKKFYRCVDNGKGGYTKYDFDCGEGTVWDQEIQGCNHPKDNQNCTSFSSNTSETTQKPQQSTSESQEMTGTTSKTETSTITTLTTASLGNEGQCLSEGFYANPSDCKKFYRCVSDGKGGFTKYDFSCGEGTVWVQEIQACDHDNDINSCSAQSSSTVHQESNEVSDSSNKPEASKQPDQPTTTSTTTESQTLDDQNPSHSSTSPTSTNSVQCTSQGFYANENDCRKFYRCVDNGKGGYTKYEFACGEGTAWDSNIQACNHINEVDCFNNNSNNPDKPQTQQDETSTESTGVAIGAETSESTTTTTTTTTSGSSSQGSETTLSSKPNNEDNCTEEGYFGNSQDCKKFYRCVDNGKGGYTKYDFDCGEGTIWDQDITACNHPGDVSNPSCKEVDDSSSSSSTTTTSSSSESSAQSTTQSSAQSTSSSTTESNNQESTNCSQESTSKKPENKNVNCTKEGFYSDPDDCKKFYRCVDWDGNGQRFSVYHFECGEGTIWDPSLDTCNHEDSVYPARDCSGTQSESENVANESTTTERTTTKKDEMTTTTTAQSQTTTEKEQSSSTEQQSTTQESTTQSTSKQTTTQKTTTQESTTEQTTTTQQSETTTSQSEQTATQSEQTTTQSEQTTTQSEQTTTQQSTAEQSTSEQSTTQQSTTETSPTQHSTTEQTTTQQAVTNESSTMDQSSTSDQTTTEQSTTSEQNTTEQSTTTDQSNTTEESTTQQSTTEQSSESTTQSTTTQESTTQQDQGSTTENQESTTTEKSTESKECPETESDQYLYVCPTGFRRHPKYCNMFYQCTEDNDTHEVKVATFNCPNNTIYDENKTQCVDENKADKKCNGQMAQKRRFKRLDADALQPMVVSKQKHSCPAVGHYPYEREDECSPAFLKCEQPKSGKIRGFVYRCPNDFVYWSVSRRCEPKSKLRNCKESVNDWNGRYEIPIEKSNVAR